MSCVVFYGKPLAAALEKSENDDRIVITGSLHFIGEAMEHLGLEAGKPGERALNDWTQKKSDDQRS